MSKIESVLVTGANAGIGKETCRLLALRDDTERVILGCRNITKAKIAKEELEKSTGKKIFDILVIDTTKITEIKEEVSKLSAPIDAVILNAGGMLGKQAALKTPENVHVLFSANVLGHAALVQTMLEQNKLKKAVVFASSEAARGVPSFGFARPKFSKSSAEEFIEVAKQEGPNFSAQEVYGPVKYIGTLWTSAMARKHPDLKFISVSPGFTTGTSFLDNESAAMKFLFNRILAPLSTHCGSAHGIETGANRYIDVLCEEKYESGKFYASPWPGTSGDLVDQSTIFEDLGKPEIQDNALKAVMSFL